MSVFNFIFLIGHDNHKDGLGDFKQERKSKKTVIKNKVHGNMRAP